MPTIGQEVTGTCVECKKEHTYVATGQRPRVTCSAKCKGVRAQKANNADKARRKAALAPSLEITSICENCNKEHSYKKVAKRRLYCNSRCASVAAYKRRKARKEAARNLRAKDAVKVETICPECKTCILTSVGKRPKLTCSAECKRVRNRRLAAARKGYVCGTTTSVCEQCGEDHTHKTTKRGKRFCSTKCTSLFNYHKSAKAKRSVNEPKQSNLFDLTCTNCDKGFKRNSKFGPVPKFCSKKCRSAKYWVDVGSKKNKKDGSPEAIEAKEAELITDVCYNCGTEHSYKPEKGAKGPRFCSDACKTEHQIDEKEIFSDALKRTPETAPERSTFLCKNCGDEHTYKTSEGAKLFCSAKCAFAYDKAIEKGKKEAIEKEEARLPSDVQPAQPKTKKRLHHVPRWRMTRKQRVALRASIQLFTGHDEGISASIAAIYMKYEEVCKPPNDLAKTWLMGKSIKLAVKLHKKTADLPPDDGKVVRFLAIQLFGHCIFSGAWRTKLKTSGEKDHLKRSIAQAKGIRGLGWGGKKTA